MEITTSTKLAEELGVTPRRVRQICEQHKIGTVVGQTRMLTPEDADRIRKLRTKQPA